VASRDRTPTLADALRARGGWPPDGHGGSPPWPPPGSHRRSSRVRRPPAAFQRHGNRPIPFSAAEAELRRLLKEYGPPRDTSPGYAFHHLTSDGLWLVDTRHGPGSPGPELRRLRDSQASGRLHPDLARALSEEPGLLGRIARYLLDANFAASLHADLCVLAGLDLETPEIGGQIRMVPVVRRDPGFRDRVLMAYEYCCAFCSYDGWLDGTAVGLDAAHVRWWAFDGPDELANGLCLCAIHHKLFDKGVRCESPSRAWTRLSPTTSAGRAGLPHTRSRLRPTAGRPARATWACFMMRSRDDQRFRGPAQRVWRRSARSSACRSPQRLPRRVGCAVSLPCRSGEVRSGVGPAG
jgi:putative restriction endonuclease